MTAFAPRRSWPWLLCLATLIVLAYLPGLQGPFLFDDLPNILDNPAIQIGEWSWDALHIALNGNQAGPLGRKIPALSFALDYYFGGRQFVPWVFKATNLAIHLLASWILFAATRRVLALTRVCADWSVVQIRMTALGAVALWALHPLQALPVVYVVQRMTSLAGLFVFAGFWLYLHGRTKLVAGRRGAWGWIGAGYLVALVPGSLSKESALLFPLLVAVAEITLLRWDQLPAAPAATLRRLLVISVALPTVALAGVLLAQPDFFLAGYDGREFTLLQRVLSEPRILWFYVSLFAFPLLSRFSLFHDDIPPSQDLLTPWTTLPACLGWMMLTLLALRFRRRYPLAAFAVLWFLAAHAMESSIFPLELAYEHRNYVASFGPSLALCTGFARLLILSRQRRALAMLALGTLAIVTFVTFTRASIWGNEQTLAYFTARNHPTSVRANLNSAMAQSAQENGTVKAYGALRKAAAADVSDTKPVMEMWRQLLAIRAHLDRVKAANGTPQSRIANTVPQNYLSPLVLDGAYIDRLRTLLAAEISRRIEVAPFTAGLVGSFQYAVICVLNERPACKGAAPQLLEWLYRALDRRRMAVTIRAQLLLMIAKLEAKQGNLQGAFERLDEAIATMPGKNAYYIKEKALLYAALGKYAQAENIVDQILNTPGFSPFEHYNARLLKKNIHALRSDSKADDKTPGAPWGDGTERTSSSSAPDAAVKPPSHGQ